MKIEDAKGILRAFICFQKIEVINNPNNMLENIIEATENLIAYSEYLEEEVKKRINK